MAGVSFSEVVMLSKHGIFCYQLNDDDDDDDDGDGSSDGMKKCPRSALDILLPIQGAEEGRVVRSRN